MLASPLPPLGDPERQLALSYAPALARPALHALWALDERLGSLVTAGREPQLRLMRLLWWRDALERLDTASPPAEPLLQALALTVIQRGVTGAELAGLEEGWSIIVEDEGALAEHAALRGGRLFELSAAVLGQPKALLGNAGLIWALVDRARASRGEPRARALSLAAEATPMLGRWPAPLRALGVLAVLARRDARAGQVGVTGSPDRLLRAIGHRLTGW